MGSAPGYLHFNLHRGCTAESLCACMAKFLGNTECVTLLLKSLGLDDVVCEVGENISSGLRGINVNFYVGGELIRQGQPTPIPAAQPHSKNIFLQTCLSGEDVNLDHIRDIFLDKNINPGLSALATKILDTLSNTTAPQQKLAGGDALWLFCHLLMLCAQVVALDPKFISASRLFVGDGYPKKRGTFCLGDKHLINELLVGTPVVESERPVAVDALALAFIKSLVGHFGARGESTILAQAIGISAIIDPLNQGLVEALWCEAHLPGSISEHGPSSKARVSFLYEVRGRVSAGLHMKNLCRMLLSHGAKSLHYFLSYDEKNIGHNMIHFLVSEGEKREAVEAFLVKGEAYDVCIREVEHHELKKRMVNVPMGSGNKIYSYRFYEYIYLDKTLRVEPLPEDLNAYIAKTDYSADVARSDMLLAWKKWRQRVAES